MAPPPNNKENKGKRMTVEELKKFNPTMSYADRILMPAPPVTTGDWPTLNPRAAPNTNNTRHASNPRQASFSSVNTASSANASASSWAKMAAGGSSKSVTSVTSNASNASTVKPTNTYAAASSSNAPSYTKPNAYGQRQKPPAKKPAQKPAQKSNQKPAPKPTETRQAQPNNRKYNAPLTHNPKAGLGYAKSRVSEQAREKQQPTIPNLTSWPEPVPGLKKFSDYDDSWTPPEKVDEPAPDAKGKIRFGPQHDAFWGADETDWWAERDRKKAEEQARQRAERKAKKIASGQWAKRPPPSVLSELIPEVIEWKQPRLSDNSVAIEMIARQPEGLAISRRVTKLSGQDLTLVGHYQRQQPGYLEDQVWRNLHQQLVKRTERAKDMGWWYFVDTPVRMEIERLVAKDARDFDAMEREMVEGRIRDHVRALVLQTREAEFF